MGGLFSCCSPPLSEMDERSALTSRSDAVTTAPEYRSIASNIEAFNTPTPEAQAPSSPPEAQAPSSPPEAQAASAPPEAQAASAPPEAQAASAPPEAQAASAPPEAQAVSSPTPSPPQSSPSPPQSSPSPPPSPPPSPALDPPEPTTTRVRSVTFSEEVSAADSEEVSVRQRSASDVEASNSAVLQGQATNASSDFGQSSC
ncbi:uncharacterized protein [Dermacentor andersoni]|uniref:uncharacterized protein n=1 Tax=Dermacentor andersoni TaxID=34620 RepID=UPI002417848B|nr:uncharacterized protein LOC126547406 [Dermacentor andersoni]